MVTKPSPVLRKSVSVVAISAICSLSLYACASSSVIAAGPSKGKGIKCTLAKVVDSQRSGLTAYTYFVPTGWEAKSSMNWNGNTYVADFTATTPDNQYMVEQLMPLNMQFVNSNGKILQGIRILKAIDYLHAMVNGLQQNGKINNVKVIEEDNEDAPLTEQEKNFPKPLPSIGAMVQTQFNQTAFMKFSFERNGQQLTGSMGTTVFGNFLSNNMQLGYGPTASHFLSENGTYVIGPTLLVMSPASPSEAKVHEAQIIASSAQMTPDFQLYSAKLALAISNAGLVATEERGKELIKQMREQTQQIHDNFMDKMAQKDADTREFCNYILDKQDYADHSGNVVTLPSAYNHSWSDGNGNYILNDDPTFDPKKDLGKLGYQEMEKTK